MCVLLAGFSLSLGKNMTAWLYGWFVHCLTIAVVCLTIWRSGWIDGFPDGRLNGSTGWLAGWLGE